MPDFHTNFSDIPLFVKTYELYKTFYGFLPTFPKKDRYSLGQRCELAILDVLQAIIVASNLGKGEKLPVLREGSTKVDLLKVLLRLAKDIKALDNKKYIILEEQLQEIGRMFGGWIKTTNS